MLIRDIYEYAVDALYWKYVQFRIFWFGTQLSALEANIRQQESLLSNLRDQRDAAKQQSNFRVAELQAEVGNEMHRIACILQDIDATIAQEAKQLSLLRKELEDKQLSV
jgi:flagellar biosynthesis chaperone FliJ